MLSWATEDWLSIISIGFNCTWWEAIWREKNLNPNRKSNGLFEAICGVSLEIKMIYLGNMTYTSEMWPFIMHFRTKKIDIKYRLIWLFHQYKMQGYNSNTLPPLRRLSGANVTEVCLGTIISGLVVWITHQLCAHRLSDAIRTTEPEHIPSCYRTDSVCVTVRRKQRYEKSITENEDKKEPTKVLPPHDMLPLN